MKKIALLFLIFLFTHEIPAQNIISLFAGSGSTIGGGDGGAATSAQIGACNMSFDKAGNMYIADFGNSRIRKVNTAGIISTVAGINTGGSSGSYGGDGGPATAANLYGPTSAIVDAAGVLYLSDGNNNRIRKVGTNGIITTIAGTGVSGYSGDGGKATSAKLQYPSSLFLDAKGVLYFADTYNSCIRKISTSGIITTVAGTGVEGFSGDGGPAAQAELGYPYALAFDKNGIMYIADEYNSRIRKIDASGIISTIAGGIGSFSSPGNGGPALNALISYPVGVVTDTIGNIYISEGYGYWVRKIDTSGIITDIAGNGIEGYSGDGGDASLAELDNPKSITFDQAGNLYLADGNVRKITFCKNPAISRQPVSDTTCELGNASFNLIACRATSINWQVDTTGTGNNFGNINNGTKYLGVTTQELALTSVTYTMNGYLYRCIIQDSVSIISDVVKLVVNPLPQMLINPSSPTYCYSGTIILNASGAANYTWTVNNGTLTNTLSPATILTPDTSLSTVIINVMGTSTKGCANYAYLQLTDSCGFVWPGDADNNLYVTNYDLLPIGLYFGSNGAARTSVSILWQGYTCANWTGSLNNTANSKFSDCNGDGIIDFSDTLAVHTNFNLFHSQRLAGHQQGSTANPDIYFDFSKPIYYPGDTLLADILLGDAANLQTNFYGAAFDIYYDPSLAISGSEEFYFYNSWLGTINQDMLTFYHADFSSGSVYASLVRINQQNASGEGKIASLKFIVADTVLSDDFSNAIYNQIKISSSGTTGQLTSGISQHKASSPVTIYPNPSSNSITIKASAKLGSIIFYSLLGEVVLKINSANIEEKVDISELPAGVYTICIKNTYRKVIKE
jgi:hypothetical protein